MASDSDAKGRDFYCFVYCCLTLPQNKNKYVLDVEWLNKEMEGVCKLQISAGYEISEVMKLLMINVSQNIPIVHNST